MEKKQELIPIAATTLLHKFSDSVVHLFKPHYTEHEDSKKVQTNPFADMSDNDKTVVMVEALTMLLAQLGASAAIDSGSDIQSVFNVFSKRIKAHGDIYHQQLLQMKEEHDEKKN